VLLEPLFWAAVFNFHCKLDQNIGMIVPYDCPKPKPLSGNTASESNLKMIYAVLN
jgi:hypothetical protein